MKFISLILMVRYVKYSVIFVQSNDGYKDTQVLKALKGFNPPLQLV